MKFRQLTIEELEALKDEFVKFLIVQGIDGAEWSRIKDNEPMRTIKVIEQFSDMIFTDIIAKVNYIDYFDKNSLKLFKCELEMIHLVNVVTSQAYCDLTDFLQGLAKNPQNFEIQKASKAYFPDRETELFNMITLGGLVSDGFIFESF